MRISLVACRVRSDKESPTPSRPLDNNLHHFPEEIIATSEDRHVPKISFGESQPRSKLIIYRGRRVGTTIILTKQKPFILNSGMGTKYNRKHTNNTCSLKFGNAYSSDVSGDGPYSSSSENDDDHGDLVDKPTNITLFSEYHRITSEADFNDNWDILGENLHWFFNTISSHFTRAYEPVYLADDSIVGSNKNLDDKVGTDPVKQQSPSSPHPSTSPIMPVKLYSSTSSSSSSLDDIDHILNPRVPIFTSSSSSSLSSEYYDEDDVNQLFTCNNISENPDWRAKKPMKQGYQVTLQFMFQKLITDPIRLFEYENNKGKYLRLGTEFANLDSKMLPGRKGRMANQYDFVVGSYGELVNMFQQLRQDMRIHLQIMNKSLGVQLRMLDIVKLRVVFTTYKNTSTHKFLEPTRKEKERLRKFVMDFNEATPASQTPAIAPEKEKATVVVEAEVSHSVDKPIQDGEPQIENLEFRAALASQKIKTLRQEQELRGAELKENYRPDLSVNTEIRDRDQVDIDFKLEMEKLSDSYLNYYTKNRHFRRSKSDPFLKFRGDANIKEEIIVCDIPFDQWDDLIYPQHRDTWCCFGLNNHENVASVQVVYRVIKVAKFRDMRPFRDREDKFYDDDVLVCQPLIKLTLNTLDCTGRPACIYQLNDLTLDDNRIDNYQWDREQQIDTEWYHLDFVDKWRSWMMPSLVVPQAEQKHYCSRLKMRRLRIPGTTGPFVFDLQYISVFMFNELVSRRVRIPPSMSKAESVKRCVRIYSEESFSNSFSLLKSYAIDVLKATIDLVVGQVVEDLRTPISDF